MNNVKLNEDQLQKLSDITADIGQAVFASILIPFAFQVDKIELAVVVLGWIVTIGCWVISITLVTKQRTK